jgi:hypothetical protein
VGAGGSREAAYALVADLPAGTYHLVLDGIAIVPVDVEFDLIWRSGSADTILATVERHFDPVGSDFDAQLFETDVDADAVELHGSDELVLRYTGLDSTVAEAYVPDGDAAKKGGRDPNITLPR